MYYNNDKNNIMTRQFIILGQGKVSKNILEKAAITDLAVSLALHGEVKLKDCHKSAEQKRAEILHKLRKNINLDTLHEYLLIMNKESALSRSKRDNIVAYVRYYATKGILTKEELKLLNL